MKHAFFTATIGFHNHLKLDNNQASKHIQIIILRYSNSINTMA